MSFLNFLESKKLVGRVGRYYKLVGISEEMIDDLFIILKCIKYIVHEKPITFLLCDKMIKIT